MKVLLLADGSSVHTTRYQAELKRLNIDVVLASIEEGETVDITLNRLTGIVGIDYMLAALPIKNIVQDNTFDIINPHFACGYGFMTALSGTWRKMPILLHCLGSDILLSPQKSWLHKWRVAYALKKADQVIVDSEYLGLMAKNIYDKTDLKVIAWGADARIFESFKKKNLGNIVGKKPLNIIVPRPHRHVYNNRYIIHALKKFIKDGNITITFPGWGDELESFKELVKCERIVGGIRYYDFLCREKFNEFISGFDIYLSASLSDSSPASLIEAMAAGLYPVVGDLPGIREWMDGNNGALFDLSDTESLGKALKNILEGQSDFVAILKQNFVKAQKIGMFSKNIEETIGLMQKMIKDAGSKE